MRQVDIVGFTHKYALDGVVALARDVDLARSRTALTNKPALEQPPRVSLPVRLEILLEREGDQVLGKFDLALSGCHVLFLGIGFGNEVDIGDGACPFLAPLGANPHARRHGLHARRPNSVTDGRIGSIQKHECKGKRLLERVLGTRFLDPGPILDGPHRTDLHQVHGDGFTRLGVALDGWTDHPIATSTRQDPAVAQSRQKGADNRARGAGVGVFDVVGHREQL